MHYPELIVTETICFFFLTICITFLLCSGGSGNNDGHFGDDGTITGKKCPVGLYGTFCTVWILNTPFHCSYIGIPCDICCHSNKT